MKHDDSCLHCGLATGDVGSLPPARHPNAVGLAIWPANRNSEKETDMCREKRDPETSLEGRFPPNETPMMPMPPEDWEKDPGEEVNDAWARGEHIPGVTQ